MLRNNLPISNLIKSDFVTINAQLATLYGIPNMTSNEFTKVKVGADSQRGGFLSSGVFLLAGSNGDRSSPTVRHDDAQSIYQQASAASTTKCS